MSNPARLKNLNKMIGSTGRKDGMMTTLLKSEKQPSVEEGVGSLADFRGRVCNMTCVETRRGAQIDKIVLRNEEGGLEMLIWNKMSSRTFTYLAKDLGVTLPKAEFDWCLTHFSTAPMIKSIEDLLS